MSYVPADVGQTAEPATRPTSPTRSQATPGTRSRASTSEFPLKGWYFAKICNVAEWKLKSSQFWSTVTSICRGFQGPALPCAWRCSTLPVLPSFIRFT